MTFGLVVYVYSMVTVHSSLYSYDLFFSFFIHEMLRNDLHRANTYINTNPTHRFPTSNDIYNVDLYEISNL